MTESNYLMEIIGGLALILYGIHLSGINLQKILGSRLETALKRAGNHPLRGVSTGAGITAAIHSSGTTTVILIGLITGSFISLSDAVPVMLGANIGSTFATQLASLRVGSYALGFLVAGVLVHILSEKKINKRIGEAIIGFSFLFLGMNFLLLGAEAGAGDSLFLQVVAALTSSPLRAFLAGALLTAFLRSASATSILAVTLGTTGVIQLPTALYLILGVNLGSSLKVLRLALEGKNFSGKLALIHLIFNLLGVGIFLLGFPLFLRAAALSSADAGRQIANAHTLYNLLVAVIFLPLVPAVIKLVEKISPTSAIKRSDLFYLDKKLICTPSVSLRQVNRGAVEMARTANQMLEYSRLIHFEGQLENLAEIERQESRIDDMTEKISEYTIQVSQQNLSREDAMQLYSLMHIVGDIEHLSDHILALASLFSELRNKQGIDFSDKAERELIGVFGKLRIMQNLVVKALDEDNVRLAQEITEHENKVDEIIKKIGGWHRERLAAGTCAEEASAYFTEILYHLERIGDHYDNIAYAIIDRYRREDRK